MQLNAPLESLDIFSRSPNAGIQKQLLVVMRDG